MGKTDNELYRRRKFILFVTLVTSFVTTFMGSALNLSVPFIAAEFHVSAEAVGWIISVYILTVAALSVPFGKIADITSRKRILVIGIAVFTVCSFGAAFVPSMKWMLIVRAFQGIGAAMIFSTNTPILISAFPQEQRGRVLGYSIAATYIGLSLGPVVGGILNQHFGWRSILLVTCGAGMISFAAAAFGIPKDRLPDRKREAFDLQGSAMFAVSVVFIICGLSYIIDSGWVKFLLPIGVLLLIAFVFWEKKTAAPILDVRLFYHNKVYAFSNLAALLNYSATFSIAYLLSLYLQIVKGLPSGTAGLTLIIQPAIMAILSPFAGRLSDKVAPYKPASAGMAFCAASLLIFSFLHPGSPHIQVVIGLVIAGIGFAFFSTPNTNAVMACVDKWDYGVASSVLATMRSLGQTFGMAVITVILGALLGSTPLKLVSPVELVLAMRICFRVFTVICLVGVAISMKRR